MMGLHQNYSVTWGAERMEGLTLDLGLDGMFSPLPTELNPVVTKDSDPPSSWRGFFGHSQTQQDITADVNLDDDEGDDPCALLHDSSNCVGQPERKPDMFELSLSYPPPCPRQQHQQLINMKVEREDVVPSLRAAMPSLPEADLTSQSEGSFNCWRNTTVELPRKELHLYGTVGDENMEEFPDDDTMDDFPGMKPERCASSSVLPAAAVLQQQSKMHPETIILDDTMDDFPEIKLGGFASNRVWPAAAQQHPQMHPETIILDDSMDDFREIKPDRCASSSILSAAAAPQQQPKKIHPETIILDDTMDDFPEMKSGRCASGSVLPAAAQQQQPKMHPETIILDDDTDDDECLFKERYTAEEDGSASQSRCGGDSSNRSSPKRRVLQAMPLRQIKQHVRSSRNDEDHNASATPSSAVPEMTGPQEFGTKELETGERNHHHQSGEQGKQPNIPNPANPKRMRGYGDHDWLPSDLLDASHSESRNEAKRARGNGNGEQHDDVPEAAYRLPMDAPLTPNALAQSTESGVQVQIQNPLIDVNQAIQEMPQDTAEVFKKLIQLVSEREERASRAVDEIKNRRPLSDVQHNDPPQPPPTPTVSQQSSRAVDKMESSRRSVAIDFNQHTPDTPAPPATLNQASRIVDEMENWCPLASDVQDDDPPASQRSATTSDFEEDDSPPLSTSDFGQNDSPPLAIVDQPIFPQGGASPCLPSESATRRECSPHPAGVYQQQHAGKRTSNADVVLYEPKQEPVESRRENNMSGSVVHVKQEPQLLYEPIPDQVSIRPVEERAAVGPCYSNRELILTALDTFEKVRQQIIRDPSYGQSVVDVQQTTITGSSKNNNRRLRADLKAASMMRKRGHWLNATVRPIGDVPGVTVGDCFSYRIEMAVIGLHRAVQAGIAVVPVEYSPFGMKVASSVVMGVGDPYQDDKDMGDTVVYSGQGGLCNRTKESQDQKLTRGNLALSNSYNLKLPVRLIRGHKEQNSKTGILYSYDGLYQIVDMNYVTGVNGKKVYKFTMHRRAGQPPLSSGYPAPLGSQPPAREPAQNAVHWTESLDAKPLYLEKSPVA